MSMYTKGVTKRILKHQKCLGYLLLLSFPVDYVCLSAKFLGPCFQILNLAFSNFFMHPLKVTYKGLSRHAEKRLSIDCSLD